MFLSWGVIMLQPVSSQIFVSWCNAMSLLTSIVNFSAFGKRNDSLRLSAITPTINKTCSFTKNVVLENILNWSLIERFWQANHTQQRQDANYTITSKTRLLKKGLCWLKIIFFYISSLSVNYKTLKNPKRFQYSFWRNSWYLI